MADLCQQLERLATDGDNVAASRHRRPRPRAPGRHVGAAGSGGGLTDYDFGVYQIGEV